MLFLKHTTFWHISEGTFLSSTRQVCRYIYFYCIKSTSFFVFQQMQYFFLRWQIGYFETVLVWFCVKISYFFEHEVSFDRKCIKIIDILIFIMENCIVFFIFLLTPNIRENWVQMSVCVNFRVKVTKKWWARKPIGWNGSSVTLTDKWKISLDVF